ncbi:MAG: hypothetical protein ACR2P2_03385 [Nakamurella sp.]
MTMLLVPDQVASIGQLGGDPLVPAGFQWPGCVSCDGPMTHIVQLGVDDRLLTVFQCENNPGMCADWEPFAGGNAAVLVTGATVGQRAPGGVKCYPPIRVGVRQLAAPYEALAETGNQSDATVFAESVGQFGGTPYWIQADETPDCPSCSAGPMRFVAQFDPGPHEFNFGDYGTAYAFDCPTCNSAAWLWQS